MFKNNRNKEYENWGTKQGRKAKKWWREVVTLKEEGHIKVLKCYA